MVTPLVLHQFDISPFCDKVRRVLRYKKVPFETREVTLFDVTSGALRRRNGTGKLPTLEHDGRLIADSSDIARYLEERFPERPLVPRDARLAAECHLLEDWADESLYFYEVYLRFLVPENARRWIPALLHADGAPLRTIAPLVVPRALRQTLDQQGLGRKTLAQVLADVERHVGALDAKLDGRAWLVGDSITLADIAVFAQLFCVQGAVEGARVLDAHPAVVAWMKRVEDATAK
jgi:glutathione S-transferase